MRHIRNRCLLAQEIRKRGTIDRRLGSYEQMVSSGFWRINMDMTREIRKWSERKADPKFAAKAKEGDRLRPRIPHAGLVSLLERAKREGRLDEAAKLLRTMFEKC